MKKNIQLTIQKPCHEKWSSFKPTLQGGFCSSCQKEVIDFTSWSEDRLKAYFKNSHSNTCGRFKPEQLTRYTFDSPRSATKGWFSVLLMSMLLLFTSRLVVAQSIKPKQSTEQYEPETKMGKVMAPRPLAEITITGVVKDEAGEGLPGANVARKGTALGTVTDGSGRFTLRLKDPSSSEVLVISFIGFKAAEYPVAQGQPVQEFAIDMVTDDTFTLMGEVAVPSHWYSPRRWWWSIRRLF